MKIKTIFGAVVLGLLIVCCAQAEPVKSDKMVAIVNSDVITESELSQMISTMKHRLKLEGKPIPKNLFLRKQALDELIDLSLQLQMAKRGKIQIDDKELDEIIANIAKQNGLTVVQMKKEVQVREGISFKEFRKRLREQGLISRLQHQALGKDVVVSEKEVQQLLHNPPRVDSALVQYHVVDVLFEVKDDVTKAQQKSSFDAARKMAVKLKSNVNVEEVVQKDQKNHPQQIIKVNDLGWRKKDEFPDLFVDKIIKMQVGQVVGPIDAPNGLHLLKLLNINDPAMKNKLTKERAYEIVYHRNLIQKLKPWLKELREKAYIKII